MAANAHTDAAASKYAPYPPPTSEQAARVVSQLQKVRQRIVASAAPSSSAAVPDQGAAAQASNHVNDVVAASSLPRLVAVSKLHPPSSILAAHVDAKQLHFGENYAQELRDKARVLPPSIRWHFVGAMQTSKAKMLADIPNLWLVETLDSAKAATALDKALAKQPHRQGDPLRVYLQVNTSGEAGKAGLPPLPAHEKAATGSAAAPTPAAAAAPPAAASETAERELLDAALHIITSCPRLELRGLMTIGSQAASQASAHELEQLRLNDDDDNVDDDARRALHRRRRRDAARRANPDFDTLASCRRALVEAIRSEVRERGLTPVRFAPSSTSTRDGEAPSQSNGTKTGGVNGDATIDQVDRGYAKLLDAEAHEDGDEDEVTGGLELSMGMSADLEAAVSAGSANVRVGTDCFGVRPPSRDVAMEGMAEELAWKVG